MFKSCNRFRVLLCFKLVCFSSKYLERSKKTCVFDRTANFLLYLFLTYLFVALLQCMNCKPNWMVIEGIKCLLYLTSVRFFKL